jgi:hypothetical protein
VLVGVLLRLGPREKLRVRALGGEASEMEMSTDEMQEISQPRGYFVLSTCVTSGFVGIGIGIYKEGKNKVCEL